MSKLGVLISNFYNENILSFIEQYQQYPIKIVY